MQHKIRLFLVAFLTLSACEGSVDQSLTDAEDAQLDSSSESDAHRDAGGTHDAGLDVSDFDATPDGAGWDSGADVSNDTAMPEDTGEDVGEDGGPADATTDTDPGPFCGNGDIDAGEACDQTSLGGQSCATLDATRPLGTLTCAADCTFDTSACMAIPCGNGIIDAGEDCDQDSLGGQSCASLDGTKPLGTLACAASCSFDTSACMAIPCGNGIINAGEDCDQDSLGGQSCASLDGTKPLGTLTCAADCSFDLSACMAIPPGDADNDGVLDSADPAPNDPRICGDADTDNCDDCSVEGTKNTNNDGYDPNNDGQCELPLDYACMNGTNAGSDPDRLEACVMFTLINQDRALFSAESGGGLPVNWNEDIWEVAHAHAVDMCTRSYFAHNTPEGVTPSQRASAAGLTFSIFENISVNLDPQASQWGFMEEPTCTGHRGSILQKRATEVGVGYFKCASPDTTYQWRNHHHIVQNFRIDFNIPQNTWCQTAANACEIPPTPPTTAVCPQQLINWGFCPQPSSTTLQGWNCPND